MSRWASRRALAAIEPGIRRASEEEHLKGTFQGADTISVKVVEEDGVKKLGFDTTKAVVESPTPAVVAGQS